MRVHLQAIGCRLNQSEIETLARQLVANGHELVGERSAADKVVINTCAVTREATRDTRALIRRARRENDDAEIVLTGCYASIAADELAAVEGSGRIVSNQDKPGLIRILDPGAKLEIPVYDQEPILRDILAGTIGNTRAFVKVQDGCNHRCTFCVTTLARGASRSRSLGDVVEEVRSLANAGYREAVLTGVHLGSYGRDLGMEEGLRGLVSAVLHHTDIARLRLSSLEPWDIRPDFFELWDNPRLLPHLHLPLQSGSDRVLRRMGRRTNRSQFRALTSAARAHIPCLNLSTDLIAGFPGETESDFSATLDYVREIDFTRLHVFTYSPRPGTVAATMPGQLPKKVRKERSRRLIALGHELSLGFHRRHEGESARVLWESVTGANSGGLRWTGYTRNYIRVAADGPADLFNRITVTRLADATPKGMSGLICL